MEKRNKSCKNKVCCVKCSKVWEGSGCKKQCDRGCEECLYKEPTGYIHDGGYYND